MKLNKLSTSKELKVYVNSSSGDQEYDLMARCGVKRARSLDDADIVLFVGGADVNPLLYGEEPLERTGFDVKTDNRDMFAWRHASDKFKIGICRGGQFLNVMNGGRLWQHVDNHTQEHTITDMFTGQVVQVSSTHHQQFRPAANAAVIATARCTTQKHSENQRWFFKDKFSFQETPMDKYFKIDHEVLFYHDTRSLCFQPHPEYIMPQSCGEYFKSVFWKAWRGEYPKPTRSGAELVLDKKL